MGELKCLFPGIPMLEHPPALGSQSVLRAWLGVTLPSPGQADSPLCSFPIFCCGLGPGGFLQIV